MCCFCCVLLVIHHHWLMYYVKLPYPFICDHRIHHQTCMYYICDHTLPSLPLFVITNSQSLLSCVNPGYATQSRAYISIMSDRLQSFNSSKVLLIVFVYYQQLIRKFNKSSSIIKLPHCLLQFYMRILFTSKHKHRKKRHDKR